jgi:hypothetical protein
MSADEVFFCGTNLYDPEDFLETTGNFPRIANYYCIMDTSMGAAVMVWTRNRKSIS